MKKQRSLYLTIIGILVFLLTACQGYNNNTQTTAIESSGNISIKDASIAPQVGGQVVEILVQEGDEVEECTVLFKLDDSLLRAQYDQTQKTVDSAEAGVSLAGEQLVMAQEEYSILQQNLQYI